MAIVPQQIQLPDGRVLDIYESGPQDGKVLLCHHGTPGSFLPSRATERAAHRIGLRMVTTSRAGYGGSTRHVGRQVVDVVGDTAAVLDAIGVQRCYVMGWSGGGPHALACGARLADRVDGVLVIAGVAPYDAEGLDFLDGMGEDNILEFGLALKGEDALRPWLEEQAVQLRGANAAELVSVLQSLLPEVDRAVLTDEFGEDMAANTSEGLRISVDGWLDDDLAFLRPWGFALDEIAVPTMLWQGSADLMVPYAHGQWLAKHIPGVVVHLEDGEGHLSIGVGALDRMFEELVTHC